MAMSLYMHRRFLVLLTSFAMIAGIVLVTASPTRAVHLNCDGESSIVDMGTWYLVHGTKGDDNINCSASDQPVEIRGNDGDDDLEGSQYDDTLKGGWGDDELDGQDGEDILYGGQDDDDLDGGADDDWLFGGQGNDELEGNEDTDTCLGGRGFDIFGDPGDGDPNTCETYSYGLEP